MKISPTNFSGKISAAGTNELRDIRPPVALPSGFEWVWWTLGGLALIALGYLAWRLWQRRRTATPAPPPMPPHERALLRLEEALALIGNPREFCIAVSDALRQYLEDRFDFRAPERTTEEFLLELRQTQLLNPAQKETLADFLQRCDLVKFARYDPAETELRDLHAAAIRLVRDTVPPPVDTAASSPALAAPQ